MKKISILLIILSFYTISCEKNLDNIQYGIFTPSTFFQTDRDANSAVSAMYTSLMEGNDWSSGWGAAQDAFRVQASQTTDEGVCYWSGDWENMNALNFNSDDEVITGHYSRLMPYISEMTLDIYKIQGIKMDSTLKNRYIGELKALRAYISQILYLYYGPVPIRVYPALINDPSAPAIPRPTKDAMVAQIIQDYTDAIAVLPNTFTGSDYGRFSKAAALTGLMKLYMQEKRWQDAITAGEQIKAMGFSLVSDYASNFSYANKGGNSEIILPIVCSPTAYPNTNLWLAHALPTDYVDPSGVPLTEWGGYRMPWHTYNKFDQTDKRLSVLLKNYPIGKNSAGVMQYKDAFANGDIGAVMVKFGPDPTKVSSQNSGVDYTVFRYADVELLLAEAINQSTGPNAEAYSLVNDVRTRAGLPDLTPGLSQTQFLSKIQDERLFELWAEGVRRDDLIRWGLYIQRAKDDGFTSVDDHLILYPLPRIVVNQSNGIIAQNQGYN
jgi:hypothetical protein